MRAMVFCRGSGTRQLILSELRQHSPFSAYLNEKQLRRLARACRLQRFAEGVELHSSPFYIMVTGKVRVESIATNETLCSRAEGDFFTRSVASVGKEEKKDKKNAEPSYTNHEEEEEEYDTRVVGTEAGEALLLASESKLLDLLEVVDAETRQRASQTWFPSP